MSKEYCEKYISPEEWKAIFKEIDEYFEGPCDSDCCNCPFIVECSE